MQDVIKRIIKIEEKAQEIVDGANKEVEMKRKEFDEKISVLERRIMGDAKKKINQIRSREMAENDVIIDEKKDKCNETLIKMEEQVRKNKDAWVDELVASVLKR